MLIPKVISNIGGDWYYSVEALVMFAINSGHKTEVAIYVERERREKSVGTTELHYSTKKRKHSFSILKAFFVPTFIRV